MGETRVVPMFPLGTVLFPHALLPLHVFEPRYRVMVRHVMEGDQEFGVVLIERGSEVGGGDTRFDVGTMARVVQMAELPDGRCALVSVGMRRMRVARWLPDDPYPRAEVEMIADAPCTADDTAGRTRLGAALERVAEMARRTDPSIGPLPEIHADPARAAYEVAAIAPIGPLDAQRVLEAADTSVRLALLGDLLDERAEEMRARLDWE